MTATKRTRSRRVARPETPAAVEKSTPPPASASGRARKPARRPGSSAGTLRARRALVRRLYRAIDTKLQQMEARMAKDIASSGGDADPTAADHERDTRAIGTLIANLSRISEIEADLDRAANPAASADAARLADEAERFRRDVAERLARLVRPAG